MSAHGPEEVNYGKKGGFMAKAIIGFIVFIILLIWVYQQNFKDLPT